jgi:hypothetical protein
MNGVREQVDTVIECDDAQLPWASIAMVEKSFLPIGLPPGKSHCTGQ